MSQNRASMLDRPVAQTFFRYGLPWSAAFLLLSSAGLVDTIFIGRYVGAQALAAVNIVSPVFSIFFGMGVMLSVGGTVRSAHHVGRGDLRAASAVFGRTMLLILLAGLVLALLSLLFRPLLLTLLPQVLTLVFRFIAELPENLVMASRATIFRMRKTRKPVPVGNRFTYTLGRALNALARLLNRTILHRHPMRTDFEYVLDASFREVSSGIRSMSVSISFGLLLLCIGLYVTCLYLLQ